ncbi:MAG: tRNA (N6-isopentenyl adenosine(37)-C2)-methylthiotransferase MiaB [Candidatus Pelagibacter sp. TMED196]|nr:MAG: tRNA (N6-isopentenyl adenosine(37)-C2)-methylthiotransferase MiaB [Candidatus Pelagibacter sp. TMED196]
MNEYDSNRISDLFKSNGYLQSFDSQNVNCYILNTCHIREKATEKVYSDIGRLKKNYRNKTKPLVLVTGCVAQAENDEMIRREPYIDAVIGPQSYQNIPNILFSLNNEMKRFNLTDFDVIEKFDKLNSLKNSDTKVSAFVTIQEGCDKFCNFCVVPYTRGSEYSRSPEEILKEVGHLVLNGAKEITLLGQNVNAYLYKKKIRLSDLILKIGKNKKLKRIRYTTSHPKDMTDDLINCYKQEKKLMPFLHLPVQSGSDEILKNMNRKHTREEYLDSIVKLKKINPEIKFSSDFIVGYPGESEKDFNDTISLIKKVNFINSFSFIYSPRPGTPASKMEMVDIKVQKKRLIILQNLLEKIQMQKNNDKIEKLEEVLVENRLKNQTQYFGRTQDLTPVILNNVSDADIGKLIKVRIDKFDKKSLFGKKCSNEREVAA